MEVSEGHAAYTGAVMSIDPAGMGKDETAYAVVKILNGQLFVTASGGFLGGYTTEILRKLARVARHNKVKQIVVESNFGDGMFSQLLKPVLAEDVGYPCTVEEVKNNIQKERRIIDTLEPLMNTHRLIVCKSVVESDSEEADQSDYLGLSASQKTLYQLFYQLSRITFERGALRHDDRLDALSIACNYWVEHMEAHVDRAVSEYHDEQIDKELNRFMDSYKSLWGESKEDKVSWM